MRIVGHGIDMIPVARIARSVERFGHRFLDRVFTPSEQAYAAERKRQTEHLAGRFAAKEAVLKALGTGWRHGIAWTDVEITLNPSGQPGIHLSGEAERVASTLGIDTWLVSITHTEQHAAASVIGVDASLARGLRG